MPVNWEYLAHTNSSDSHSEALQRAKVPGGWLVKVATPSDYGAVSITFYPDPEHKWDGNSLP